MRTLLWAQAAVAGAGALAAAIGARHDAVHLGYGPYGQLRTHVITAVVIGLATAVASGWAARLLSRPSDRLFQAIFVLEVFVLADFSLALMNGVFTAWLAVGVPLAATVLWYRRAAA